MYTPLCYLPTVQHSLCIACGRRADGVDPNPRGLSVRRCVKDACFMQAIKLLAVVGAPFELHELEGGARVLQSHSHSSQQARMRILLLSVTAAMATNPMVFFPHLKCICLQSKIPGGSTICSQAYIWLSCAIDVLPSNCFADTCTTFGATA